MAFHSGLYASGGSARIRLEVDAWIGERLFDVIRDRPLHRDILEAFKETP